MTGIDERDALAHFFRNHSSTMYLHNIINAKWFCNEKKTIPQVLTVFIIYLSFFPLVTRSRQSHHLRSNAKEIITYSRIRSLQQHSRVVCSVREVYHLVLRSTSLGILRLFECFTQLIESIYIYGIY